jgi:hypothetical protein
MDDEALTTIVIEALNRIQNTSGHPMVPIVKTTCPIKDLPEFDSLLGIETTLDLESQLGPLGCDNVFVNATGTRALTIGEIVMSLQQRLAVRSLQ